MNHFYKLSPNPKNSYNSKKRVGGVVKVYQHIKPRNFCIIHKFTDKSSGITGDPHTYEACLGTWNKIIQSLLSGWCQFVDDTK